MRTLLLRAPLREDAANIWRLAGACDLDHNAPYMYLVWCRDFADTSLIAEVDGDIAGFVIGYRRPTEPATLFVWQIGVSEAWRRQGLALGMLAHLCKRLAPDLHFVEASVTPGNRASASLFRSLATSSGAELATAELFDTSLFPPGSPHDSEVLVRVGPFASDGTTCDITMDVERPVPADRGITPPGS